MISPGILASIVDINGPDARKFAERNTIYVSPTGKDGYLGATPNLPVKTLAGVKGLISKLKQGDAKNIKVEFKTGNYKAEEFFFNDNNKLEFIKDTEGGNSIYNLTFRPYNNNNVVFDNSITYTGFISAGSLWKMEIDPFDMRKLNMFGFVNDVRTIPARWPKYGVSIDSTFTVNSKVYRRAIDSTGFLQSIFSYQTAGNDMSKIGTMGVLDYRAFRQGSLPPLTASLPGYKKQPNVFYIEYSSTPNLQVFANQSTIITPRIQNSNYVDGPYYGPIVDITYQMISACPLLVYDYFALTIQQYIVSPYYTTDIFLSKYNPALDYTRVDEYSYDNYYRDTSLSSQFVYLPAVTILSGLNWWYPDGGSGSTQPLRPAYQYEPSNLDPYIVCSVEGENTVISENGKYYFYYKPTQDDQLAGISNCILKTYNIGSSETWYGRFGINNVSKNSSGIQYGIIPDKYSAYSSGFCIVNPNYITFEDLTFNYCVAPLTLVTLISTDSNASAFNQQSDAIRQYSTNLTISGCKLYNTYSVGIQLNSTSKSKIVKNLIYSTEAAGIAYRAGGHDVIITNNIIKSSQQIDTRLNGDGRGAPGNIQIDGSFYGGHHSRSLTGVQISNNDFSFAGTNLIASVGQDISAYNNRVYNSGFGTNSDMACVYSGFSFPPSDKLNYLKNNLIYNSRNDGNFLASGIYIDGGSNNMQIENNIISKVHTGIEYSNASRGRIVNNIVYDTKQIAFFQGVTLTKSSYVQNNIIVPGVYKDSNYIDGRVYSPLVGYYVSHASSHVNRIQSPTYIAVLSGTDGNQYTMYPAFSWKGKLKYVTFAGGGTGSIQSSPILFFNGDNWVVADYNGTTALFPYVSSINTSIYDNPWDIPVASWVNLSSTGYLKNQWYFKNFKCILRSNSTYGITTPAISGDNNLFWSLMLSSTHPESDSIFFNIAGKTFENRFFYSTLSSISSTYSDDSSRPDIFASYIKPIDINSKLADPLFIDPENLDFSLDLNSPAYDVGFQDINTSNIGVYNTDADTDWVELANNLIPQPVIFGNTNWADFEAIPYPYNPNVEYYTDNNPTLNELNDLKTLTPWIIGKTTVAIISSTVQGISGIFNFNISLTATADGINIIQPNSYLRNGIQTSASTSGRWVRQVAGLPKLVQPDSSLYLQPDGSSLYYLI